MAWSLPTDSPLLPFVDGSARRARFTVDQPRLAPLDDVPRLLAGATEVDLTPPPGLPKAGYSANAHDGGGFRTRLRARVLHLRAGAASVALVQCDLLGGSAVVQHLVARGIADHTERVYGAMVANLDRAVGRVLEALRAEGLEENTLVFFTSDNGGANYVGLPNLNRPYRGWKMTFFEGGVHMPFFVKWPRELPAGGIAPAPIAHFDIFATAAAAAGAPLPVVR